MTTIIAYQGVPGAYSHQDAYTYFGKAASLQHFEIFADTLHAVEQGMATHVVFPVENTIGGPVQPNIDLLKYTPLMTQDELWLPMEHCLLALPKQPSLTLMPLCRTHKVSNNAVTFCHDISGRKSPFLIPLQHESYFAETPLPTTAAIASYHVAHYYGLTVLAEHIANQDNNQTRFLILTRPKT